MRPLLRTPLALLAMFASVAATSTAVAHAADPMPVTGVGVALVNPQIDPADPRTQTAIVGNLDPGATTQRRVRVTNNTPQAQTVDVYVGAASEWNQQFTVADRGTTNRLTGWNSVDRPQVQLSSGQSTEVAVTVAVPADAPVGNQYAVVWAQPVAAGGGGVGTQTRAGVREYVTVGAGAGQSADFQIRSLAGERDVNGRAVVVATVHNSGTRAVDLESELTLSKAGTVIGPVPADRVVVAAGADTVVRFVIPGTVSDGSWQAHVTSRAGAVVRELTSTVTWGTSGGGSLDFGSLGSGSLGSGSAQ